MHSRWVQRSQINELSRNLDRSWFDKNPKEVIQKLGSLLAEMKITRDSHLIVLDNPLIDDPTRAMVWEGLSRPVSSDTAPAKPWLAADPRDPEPEQPWYTPARYFARQLVAADTTILTKKLLLAAKVSKSLFDVGICKRGNKKPLAAETVLKAFPSVILG